MEASPRTYPAIPADPLGSLIARIADGHQASVGALYDATNSRVFGLVLRIVRDRAAAEEATIDVYTQVWRQANRYQPSRGTVMVWLLSLARSRAIDSVRSRFRKAGQETALESSFDLADPVPGPEAASVEAERARTVRLALRSLPSEQQQALATVYFGGLSHSQAAEALHQPLGTVKTRVRMGLVALRRALHPVQDGLT